MIRSQDLLPALAPLLSHLEDDLRQRAAEDGDVASLLRAEYDAARRAGRTVEAYVAWLDALLDQVAAAWVLGCVFVRFIEDNGLVERPYLSGPGNQRDLALDRHALYFQERPVDSDRNYLLHVFREVGKLPAAAGLFEEAHNPLWQLGPSGDGATKLLDFWQRIDPETGELHHDFTDSDWDTRFLGDLYQDLSEAARKRYALLQTPVFVEAFILDRTLSPAMAEFGFAEVRLIDPACGSGHFLLGAFSRVLEKWLASAPGTNARGLVGKALGQIYGVDVNPFAATIARFRLLVAALKASGVERLADAPAFRINVAVGDALLHSGRRERQHGLFGDDGFSHCYRSEDRGQLRRILGQRYHAVVGNPPYITVKDAALNELYRERYRACHRQYSLAAPFMQAFFDLAQPQENGMPAGFVGMITANSFMKREFGKKLIEEHFPGWDVTHVVDTSGAYIPGHGTPTVILFGRNRRPVSSTVRTVMGIRGEPSTPEDAAKGLVWTAILEQIDRPGSDSEYVSVDDTERERFHQHPWSLRGGGAAGVKAGIENAASMDLEDLVGSIGFGAISGEDNVFLQPSGVLARNRVAHTLPLVPGDVVRDWVESTDLETVWPNKKTGERLEVHDIGHLLLFFWPYRTNLRGRKAFGQPIETRGIPWWAVREVYADRFRTPLSIAFAFVATHNHFVLDRGGKVFKQSAPVIKLPPEATEDDHLGLLGLLNSSTACFWMKQMFHCKGSTVDQHGARQTTVAFEDFYEHDATKLKQFPLPAGRPLSLARRLDRLAQDRAALLPAALVRTTTPTRAGLAAARAEAEAILRTMIALQEELDWTCYRLYGLIAEDLDHDPDGLPPIDLGERAFEIALARELAAGDIQTTWFERHRSTPITEIPGHWPKSYRDLVSRRLDLIARDPAIRLIEQPEYKRRWHVEPWESLEQTALRAWLLDRLERPDRWPTPALTSTAKLADRLQGDADFQQVAALYTKNPSFDLAALVTDLVAADAAPYLAAYRYTASGLRKRAAWESTWDLQRREDAIDALTHLPEHHPEHLTGDAATARKAREIGDIPVPPKYGAEDFQSSGYWRLRGKLDVPKERFILYPGAERAVDPSPVIGWAGWNFLEKAQALAAYYHARTETEGWPADRLTPLLAGLGELVPWLVQWHNELDLDLGVGAGDFFASFVAAEARTLGLTVDQLRAWNPPKRVARGRRRR
ncbi:MAG: BREX-2 system adenine-specific DNA-methyltransferase PglX [Candidatus Schekmanbacteria bacterium]|nr:BREX-2 system adenine-specific DNA-methyltransferase PglX [Candidatus Schekmanbacteria bacterium]